MIVRFLSGEFFTCRFGLAGLENDNYQGLRLTFFWDQFDQDLNFNKVSLEVGVLDKYFKKFRLIFVSLFIKMHE